MTAASLRGRILTFYSYKGGTGRSMLLANVAWLLALQGKRVLTIDWDLEAPGLHRYFAPFLEDKELAFSDGLLDFVENYRKKAMTPPLAPGDAADDWYLPHADIADYAVTLKWDFPDKGRIDFVPAGRQDAGYSELVNSFDWKDFYTPLGGSQFLQAAADIMRRDYDYVLIDSRTGVSDTSGVCTVKMPDALVVCFTLNYQSINGAAAVADYAYEQRSNVEGGPTASTGANTSVPFNIFPVPTRLEDAQRKKMERRREYARSRRFARYPLALHRGGREDYWAAVGLRYESYYAYEEILAVFGENERLDTSLLASVQRITAYLTEGDVEGVLTLPLPRRDEILRAFEGDTYEAGSAPTGGHPDEVIARLRPDDLESARRAMLRLVAIGEPPRYEVSAGRAWLHDLDPAERGALDALARSQLVTFDPEGRIAEIARHVVLSDFRQLQSWTELDRDFLVWRQRLGHQARSWQLARNDQRLVAGTDLDSALLTGADLSVAQTWLRSRPLEISASERAFIEASAEQDHFVKQRDVVAKVDETVLVRTQLQSASMRRPPAASATAAHPLAPVTPDADTRTATLLLAREVLRGKTARLDEVRQLAKTLKNEQEFTYARRLLAQAINDPALDRDKTLRLAIFQECALCTYKDPDLPVDQRLDRALDLLRRADDLDATTNQETLGLAGAIYKRKWEVDGQVQHLQHSLRCYRRGYEVGVAKDQGYCGINAAFVLDLICDHSLADAGGASSQDVIEARRFEARRIRERILLEVAPLILRPDTQWLAQAWWFYATLAEAAFGLERYDEALEWLQRGRTAVATIPVWETQSSLQQLARMALLQANNRTTGALELSKPWQALTAFFGDDAAAVGTAFIGKVGLALSGGGFRAALFHIGTLAKLAELDVLRHVQVLSCVSGGSIVGAYYYLELRRLLQSKPDAEITSQDYIEIVRRIETEFVLGVQRNVRMRVLAGLGTNLRMLFQPGYSRTRRVGELYEELIFARVADGEGNVPRWMHELDIRPVGEAENFIPKRDNWRRRAKVPILILNATCLNTGHGWQFTTSWMGESPTRLAAGVDTIERLRRMYYWEAPDDFKRIRLGDAVAASSCVPGLFEPLTLPGLYPDRTVLLVDGGVCDNQGTTGLLDQDCNVTLVSDGSGQAEGIAKPGNGVLAVPLRANTILQARVRDTQYQELQARKRAGLLRGLMFVHLREDLDQDPVDWVDCPDPFIASTDARLAARRGVLTSYGIDKEVQSLLSGLRTDLDSFADLEADALMTSGYRMVERQFNSGECRGMLPVDGDPQPWAFLGIEPALAAGNRSTTTKDIKAFLGVGRRVAFKVWALSPALRVARIALAIATIVGLVWLSIQPPISLVPAISHRMLLGAVLGFVIAIGATQLLGRWVVGAIQWRESLYRVLVGIGMCVVGWLLARIHLWVFDPWFLSLGSANRWTRDGQKQTRARP